MGPIAPHIGTLNEKPLHAALRAWVSEEGDLFEVPVCGFVADILRGPMVVEIQTQGASRLRTKLSRLLVSHPVRLVIPVAVQTVVVTIDAEGRSRRERVSPHRGTVIDVFRDLVGLRDVLADPNLSLDVVLIRQKEIRQAGASRGRPTHSVCERHLLEIVDCTSFSTPADYLAVLPAELAEPFTTADLAAALGRPRWLAQKVAYVLRGIGALLLVGKEGRALLYRRTRPADGAGGVAPARVHSSHGR
ncbi:MAG: hypothetical protein AB1778_00770 [Candidatus Bipolaricaulota bacterium]